MTASQLPVIIFLIPFVAALLAPIVGFWKKQLLQPFTSLALGASAGGSVIGLLAVIESGPIHHHFGGWIPPLGIEWVMDGLSAGMALLISFMAFVTIASTRLTARKEMGEKLISFYTCSLLLVSGLLGIVFSGDLFNIFVFLEVASLSGYALVASGGPRSRVAGFRYLLLGTVGASFYLLGVGYVYAATGTLNMADVAARLPAVSNTPTFILGLTFILVGLCIKMGLFPLHGWLPDAYTYASNTASALIAPIMTKTAIYALIRILFWVYGIEIVRTTFPVTTIMAWAGAIAILAGSIMAFTQTDLKRMLAYSSIAQVGFIILGIGLANPTAMVGAYLHIANHALMKGCLFLVVASAGHTHEIKTLKDLSLMRRRMPWTMGAFWVAALSMIGIPPACGFFSKWYILLGALEAGQPLFAALILGSSLLTAAYFFKALEYGFSKQSPEGTARATTPIISEGPRGLVLATTGLSLLILMWGPLSSQLLQVIKQVALPQGL